MTPQTHQGAALSDAWNNKEFGRVHDEFLHNTGHAPSMLDMWLIGSGKMDTNGHGISADRRLTAEQPTGHCKRVGEPCECAPEAKAGCVSWVTAEQGGAATDSFVLRCALDEAITIIEKRLDVGSSVVARLRAALTTQPQAEPTRPDVLENLTYHQHERDDLTLDDCLSFLAAGWKKVHGRTERQMVLQLTSLLAGATPTAQPQAEPRELTATETAALDRALRKSVTFLDAQPQAEPRPLEEWTEEDGQVVWWRFPLNEAAWIGSPLGSDWPGYHTHWTPHPTAPTEPT